MKLETSEPIILLYALFGLSTDNPITFQVSFHILAIMIWEEIFMKQ